MDSSQTAAEHDRLHELRRTLSSSPARAGLVQHGDEHRAERDADQIDPAAAQRRPAEHDGDDGGEQVRRAEGEIGCAELRRDSTAAIPASSDEATNVRIRYLDARQPDQRRRWPRGAAGDQVAADHRRAEHEGDDDVSTTATISVMLMPNAFHRDPSMNRAGPG